MKPADAGFTLCRVRNKLPIMRDRLKALFMIRPGEGRTLAYLTITYIVIGLGMAIGRGSADALFFKRFGVEYLPHMLLLTSVLLVTVSMAYAAFVDRLRPGRMYALIFLLSALALLGVWLAMRYADGVAAFAIYYLMYGVMSEILLAHFQVYLSEFLDLQQSKRLLPFISAGARLGAVFGGVFIGLTGGFIPLENMALMWVALLGFGLLVIQIRHRGEPFFRPKRRGAKKSPVGDLIEGIRFARQSDYLKITSWGVFLVILVISIQDYLASTIITRNFETEGELASFLGWFFAITNAIVLVLQLFVISRLTARYGVERMNLVFPISSIGTMGLLTLSASFLPAVLARFNHMGMLFAFRNPISNLMYGAFPGYMVGRARAMIVGLVMPLGMAFAGLLLMLVPKAWVDERLGFAGLLVAIVYFVVKLRKNRLYGQSLLELIRRQVFSGKAVALDNQGMLSGTAADEVIRLIRDCQNEDEIIALGELLANQAPQRWTEVMLEIAPRLSARALDILLRQSRSKQPADWQTLAERCMAHEEVHLRATAIELLGKADPVFAARHAQSWLHDPSARIRALGAYFAISSDQQDLCLKGHQLLGEMLNDSNPAHLLAALQTIARCPDPVHMDRVASLLQHTDNRVRACALRCYGSLCQSHDIDAAAAIEAARRDNSGNVRAALVATLPSVKSMTQRLKWLSDALSDPDKRVRDAADTHAAAAMPTEVDGYRAALLDYAGAFRMQSLLCRCLATSDIPERRELLHEIARRQIAKALATRANLQQANHMFKQRRKTSAEALITLVLSEEVLRHIDLVLEIMSHLDEGEAIHLIRTALASQDRHLRAQATESVRHLGSSALVRELLPLLEEESAHPGTHTKTTLTWQELLDWCAREGGLWLQECATLARAASMEKS